MIQLFTLRRAHQATGSAALTYQNIWWVAWWIIVRIRLHSTLHHSADPASAVFVLHYCLFIFIFKAPVSAESNLSLVDIIMSVHNNQQPAPTYRNRSTTSEANLFQVWFSQSLLIFTACYSGPFRTPPPFSQTPQIYEHNID